MSERSDEEMAALSGYEVRVVTQEDGDLRVECPSGDRMLAVVVGVDYETPADVKARRTLAARRALEDAILDGHKRRQS